MNSFLLFCCCFLCCITSGTCDELPITIIVPSYNNKDWYQLNLKSILAQKYENFRVIYINDVSTDETGRLVEEYLREMDLMHRVTLIQNEERIGALANIYHAVWTCNPSEIIVTVDGDDWLFDENVLQKLNSVYSDSNVWMTYGQYIAYPSLSIGGARQVPDKIIRNNAFRDYDWVTTHLRSFYAGLFQEIWAEDFLYKEKFFPVAADLASMFPMLEMAGFHSRFIPEILYVYNTTSLLSDGRLYPQLQQDLEQLIRSKNRYSPISKF